MHYVLPNGDQIDISKYDIQPHLRPEADKKNQEKADDISIF